ncbi:eukaryotic translation initiation factor 3 subunit C [Cryptococcus neoformans C23]|uniref:Eukaryotic translation initiation factor 3 subunit C n=2 Tax=Cryptococcus neoformans TaxID=5207 RepID=A0A854QGI6_CRYNE|nr:translation initiation factor 3 subunit C [Cryptococcus neoformans var. grubii H99]AUB25175.1 eukaryotic translation initiation factor 3 subunit C [Cryptococcus neoformans var. grubii]OWZ31449.1 eukaryotic translation initiation factor 3 subunit C [Cryptococcus neoformans var. grubii AD2-60a]OWZ43610.1 eukaryotic translation initiation factor 3 subunit C [Cryptococcus neoformans var. grubii C23]OWZ54294.1 eukaryotic translation initiation factor 3 subunit C [Cryptococcus neoformans var. grub|eukprot:XP_012050239.1 translation initiation factor 3 subunit C [Cryptococcus neoformans var. grubii H99]
MSFFAKLQGSDSESSSGSDSEESILSGSEGERQDKKLAAQKKQQKSKASMFLNSDESESEEESSDEDEEEMSDSDDERQAVANKFLNDAASSDEESEEEDKIIVLSAKDKRFAEMEAAIHSIQNAVKNTDWVLASSELDKLFRFITRHLVTIVASPIPPEGHIPPRFLETLVSLEGDVAKTLAAEKSAPKKMAPAKAKAVNGIRQTLKKKNKEFEGVLKTYNEDPEAYTAAYEKANAAPAAPKPAKKAAVTTPGEGEGDEFMTIGKGGKALNLTADGVFKTLREIFEARGRKNTDRAETIKILTKLLEVSETTYQKIRVLLALVPARLDYSQHLVSIPQESWVAALQEFDQLISILIAEPDYLVQETVGEYDDLVERTPEVVDGKKQKVLIAGSLISLLESLDSELTKTLQHTDAHEKGDEYIDRLKHEAPLYTTIVKAQTLFEREQLSDNIARTVIRRLEHIYAKPDVIIEHFESKATQAAAGLKSEITPFDAKRDASGVIHDLAVFIYQSDAPVLRARAILYHIFNQALHGRYHQARDLLLMSHLQDTISHADVTTQILYNRAVMQVGLAAFRLGFIPECQTILSEMFSTLRQKELLAQSVQRYNIQLSPEQELLEKRRLLPFHMHLNVELLEAAYLTSCMLVEIPLLASVDTEEQRRRVTSKTFKRLLDMADRQAFMGPPENTRDHIIKASQALQAGEWEKARDLIVSIKVWGLLDNAAEVKDILAKKIQEEGLRTSLFTYAAYYDSLSLSHLASTFNLPVGRITSIISRMIYTDELAASLDQIDGVVIFHRVEQSEVQRLAQQLAERTASMLEQNEKTLDVKLGNQGQGQDRDTRAAGGEGGRQQGERRGGRGTYRGRGGRGGRGGFNQGLGTTMGRRVTAQ